MTSLAMQRGAVEHLIALHDDEGSTVGAAAKDACRTLAWLEKRQELIRAIEDLNRRSPALADILLQFPGSTIADVRLAELESMEHEGD